MIDQNIAFEDAYGAKMAQLCRREGHVARSLRRRAMPAAKKSQCAVLLERRKKVLRLHQDGVAIRRIAQDLKISRGSIYHDLKLMGVKK